jgi:hypothetical protein
MKWMWTTTLVLLIATTVAAEADQCTAPPSSDDGSSCQSSGTDKPNGDDGGGNNNDDSLCGLYMAESAIPNSGLGMFSARAIPTNERIFYGDVVINVEDFEENMKLRQIFNREDPRDHDKWLLKDYVWTPEVTSAVLEADDVDSIVPGYGMLANSHPGLVNSIMSAPKRITNLHRGRDPGAGASTFYHDIHFMTRRRPVEAGAELFVEYGDEWFSDRTKDLGVIPLSRDFLQADKLLRQIWDTVDGKLTTDLAAKVWKVALTAIGNNQRLRIALPDNVTDVERVLDVGGSASNSVPGRIKSPEWLEENGRCLDNIQPGDSTILQAGKGAFATRHIAKGTIVAPLPLVHLRRHHMDVYDRITESEDSFIPPRVHIIGKQLLLNYCYGHPESSIILFPYSPVVNYVNHHPTDFNVKLQWSQLPNHKVSWLEKTPEDLARDESHAGLILEMVAARDIGAGEEVLLNYGDSWDASWEHYRAAVFDPVDGDKKYVSSAELNALNATVLTEEGRNQMPFPHNVDIYCYTPNYADREIDDPFYTWSPGGFSKLEGVDNAFPCRILGRNENGYKVQVEIDDREFEVHDVPRDMIEYFDASYSSDLFLRTAFRHEIGLPDELVPPAWRDIK